MEEYGLELTSFYVNEISTPEDDPSVGKLKEALSKRAEMEIIGYNYQQERSFDTLENAVSHGNADAGSVMGAGMGTWNGIRRGREMGNQFSSMAQNIDLRGGYRKIKNSAPQCGNESPGGCKVLFRVWKPSYKQRETLYTVWNCAGRESAFLSGMWKTIRWGGNIKC